jgi:hypothetical protein
MNAHFFDIDTIIKDGAMVWIVSRSKPSDCILKVSQSDFNLMKKGIFKSHGNLIRFGGVDYYLPDNIMSELVVRCKKINVDTSDLAISMKEFMDPELVDTSVKVMDIDVMRHLNNTEDDVYIICSRKIKKSYEVLIRKLEDKLEDFGIKPDYYFVGETLYDRDEDEVSFDKVRLLVQHLVGLKTEGRKFTDDFVKRYDKIYFYDEDEGATKLACSVSSILTLILQNSAEFAKESIRNVINNNSPVLVVNTVTPNLANRFVKKEIKLEYSSLIKSFESYRYLG